MLERAEVVARYRATLIGLLFLSVS